MSTRSDEVVVPFGRFLEARERRRRASEAGTAPAVSPFYDDSPPAAADAVALPQDAVAATARVGAQDAAEVLWTSPESPNRGTR